MDPTSRCLPHRLRQNVYRRPKFWNFEDLGPAADAELREEVCTSFTSNLPAGQPSRCRKPRSNCTYLNRRLCNLFSFFYVNAPCRDSRIRALISNGMQEKKRSFFVVVGDHSKDVIVYLHHIMSNANLKHNKSVLWAYKNKLLGFTRCAKWTELTGLLRY